ncbi:MAG: Z1 domain-containing protein [Candidatus Cloacimonetes bacterium]|nr:Z1 domain-containing protein [Candidatus Cloacimonadota bacterium]
MNQNNIIMKLKNNKEVWSIKTDGFFRKQIENQLYNDDIPSEAVDDIFNNAADILNECPNPLFESESNKTGIVIGKVQSGKTSNFISLIALSFDNNYKICIVFGGNKNNLLDQNKKRLENSFQVDPEKLVIITTKDNASLMNAHVIQQFLDEGRKVIIVSLKHPKHINVINNIFANSNLCDYPTLIIDDEGDQATLNTRTFTNSMSSTYRAAIELKNRLKVHCFLSITATPQANILIETVDMLSPDFGKLVYPGNDYCGLQEFHGDNQDRYIKVIPDEEPNLLDINSTPTSIYSALASFFVGGAIRRYRGDHKNHAMLIHPSQKKYDHRVVVSKIENIMERWKMQAAIKLQGNNDISYRTLRNFLFKAYEEFKNDGVQMPEFSDIEFVILDIITKCSPVHLCNSDEDASENSKLYKYNIFVGGNMVERGITIKGLAVTYITRRARGVSNVDNTEQRARWFGYKRSYLDVCRVYTTEIIKREFSIILEHDEDLWASIERAQEKGLQFKEIPRIFILASDILNLTRRNVARAERFRFTEWIKQDKFLFDKTQCFANHELILAFRKANEKIIKDEIHNGVNIHRTMRNLDFFQLNQRLLQNFYFPIDSRVDKHFFNKVEYALKKSKINAMIDVFWIRDISHETRAIDENGRINQLFQGRNPNVNSPTFYMGDNALATQRPEVMQLQIHYVKPSNRSDIDHYSPTFALYIPQDYSEQMTRLIGKI